MQRVIVQKLVEWFSCRHIVASSRVVSHPGSTEWFIVVWSGVVSSRRSMRPKTCRPKACRVVPFSGSMWRFNVPSDSSISVSRSGSIVPSRAVSGFNAAIVMPSESIGVPSPVSQLRRRESRRVRLSMRRWSRRRKSSLILPVWSLFLRRKVYHWFLRRLLRRPVSRRLRFQCSDSFMRRPVSCHLRFQCGGSLMCRPQLSAVSSPVSMALWRLLRRLQFQCPDHVVASPVSMPRSVINVSCRLRFQCPINVSCRLRFQCPINVSRVGCDDVPPTCLELVVTMCIKFWKGLVRECKAETL